MEVGGQKIITVNVMSKNITERNAKLIQVVELLKFILTLDDQEITHSTIESIIEILEEEISK